MSIKQDVINEIFMVVAGLLPGDWFWKQNPEGWATRGHLNDRASGMSLYVHLAQSGKNQFHVYPQAPKDSRGQIPYDVSKNLPDINISAAKPASAIAKDIERRLLAVWEPRYQKALERIAESNAYVETTLSIAEKIAEVVNVRLPNQKPGDAHKRVSFEESTYPIFRGLSSCAEIEGYGNVVKLELFLTPDDAVTLLKFMVKS
jgi:hypothetical protein